VDLTAERNAPHGATLVGAIGRDGGKKYTRHMTQRQSNTDNTTAGTEAEEIAKPNSGSNMNLRATTTWEIQNNDEGDGHPDSEEMCGVHIRGGTSERRHWERQEETSGKTTGTSTITDKDSRRDGTHTTIARRSDSI
jgi:hypothetical protein